MRATALRAWPRLFAWLRLPELPDHSIEKNRVEEDISDHIKRDLGLLDGRNGIGPGKMQLSDELREAIRLQPRSL